MDLASQLSKYFGVEITAERDVLFPAAENTDTFEILVGDTDRPESAEAVKGLKTRDFACAIYGNKIVLNGTSAAMVTRAVKRDTPQGSRRRKGVRNDARRLAHRAFRLPHTGMHRTRYRPQRIHARLPRCRSLLGAAHRNIALKLC